MQRAKTVFNFAYEEKLVPEPIHFGTGFQRPKRDKLDNEREAHRLEHGAMMFEAPELRQILGALKNRPALHAMILIAANCAFGQTDLAKLPRKAVDLDKGWITFARSKTGVGRRIPLWEETATAIREWLGVRPKPATDDDAKLLFLTKSGVAFIRDGKTGRQTDNIGPAFSEILGELGLHRSRRGLYAIRHGFETIAGQLGDQVAVNAIMGRKDSSIAATYRERIGDERLVRVVEHVRKWVFAEPPDEPGDGDKTDSESLRTCVPSEPSHENVEPPQYAKRTQNPRQYARTQSTQNSAPALRIFREETA